MLKDSKKMENPKKKAMENPKQALGNPKGHWMSKKKALDDPSGTGSGGSGSGGSSSSNNGNGISGNGKP